MKPRDVNLNVVEHKVEQEYDGLWGSNVWIESGDFLSNLTIVKDVRRYYYDSRSHARKANISHEVGQFGRVK